MTLLKEFKEDPFSFILEKDTKDIISLIKSANEKYRNSSELLMNDEEYDLLMDELKERDPKNKLLSKVGAEVHTKEKVKLPYYMGSMDKIKPDTGELEKWKKKFKGSYVISDKLDGTSALLVFRDDGVRMLFTRGDGTYGTDISSMISGVNGIPTIKENLVVRGELIIPKKKFKKFEDKYSNARAMVNGLVNKKSIDKEQLKYIDFVAYELVNPWTNMSKQFDILKKFKINLVNYKVIKDVNEEVLSEHLKLRKKESDYDVDGIIVIDNNSHERNTSKNPKYGFAFKDILEEQMAETEIIKVEWNVSKDGYIKPRIHLKPVKVGGITIKHVTGNNAKYIKDNGIGKGTKIKIIRSGDVIPKIHEVLVKKKPDFPDFDYIWNETNVDIMIDKSVNNEDHEYDMLIKNLTYFFKKMKIKYVDEAIIKKMVDIGLDSINKILLAKVDDFLEVEGFKDKMAKKIFDNIQDAIKDVDLNTLMAASNIFGHGLGERKLKLVIDQYPDIFSKTISKEKIVEMLIKLDGFETKTATKFIEGYDEFKQFLKKNPKIVIKKVKKSTGKSTGTFKDMKIVFTGFRDKDLEKFVENEGGTISSSVSSNTNMVVTNDKSSGSSKLKAAEKHNILILSKEDFVSKFKGKTVNI